MARSLERYRFSPGEASVFVEIYLPKKSRFQAELYDALDAGFLIENVKRHLETKEAEVRELMQNYYLEEYHPGVVKAMPPLLGGYSIYEVDGYFYNEEKKRVDEERTQVVRIMFRPPEFQGLAAERKLKRRVMRDYLRFSGNREDFEPIFIRRIKVENPQDGERLSATGDLRDDYMRLVRELRDWECQVALFIFGYVIFRMCERIKHFEASGIDAEEEIWVTSFWNLSVNRVVAVKRDVSRLEG